MTNWKDRTEFISNISLILCAVVFVIFLASSFLSPGKGKAELQVPSPIGRTLPFDEIDWSQSERTLVIFMQKDCRFCNESVPFYQRLTKEFSVKENLRIVVGFPDNLDGNTLYLKEKMLDVKEVMVLPFDRFHVGGTPTLLLVSRDGSVANQWVGKLPSSVEDNVIRDLRN